MSDSSLTPQTPAVPLSTPPSAPRRPSEVRTYTFGPSALMTPAMPAALAAWTWEDAARETWRVYRRALAHPHRPCVTAWRRPRSLTIRAAQAQPDLTQ